MVEYQENCRICNGTLEDKLSLGELHPSGFMKPGEKWPDKAPLILAECHDCGLVQLRHTVPLDSMYREYWYRSGLNSSMVADLKDVANGIEREIAVISEDVVLDIGCNDGTLFDFYTDADYITKIGYDPARNLEEEAERHTDYFINDYFSADFILEKFGPHSIKVITAIAMFYDLPDPNWFLQEIKQILHPAGIFVVQFTDLLSMLRMNGFDNICHEHLAYYSLEVLDRLMRENDFEIFHVEYNKVNGGSLRAYIQHAGTDYVTFSSVQEALESEAIYMLGFDDPLKSFENRINIIKERVIQYLSRHWLLGNTIHIMGASTKGNTLLQYFELDSYLIPYAAEINRDKFGLVTVGSNIYILSEGNSVSRQPDVYLVLPWHFESTFTRFLERNLHELHNTSILFPLPEPRYYHKSKGEFKWTSLKNLRRCS